MNRGGGCAGAIFAFTIAGVLIYVLERAWPFILATLAITFMLAAIAAARKPAAPVPALSMAKASAYSSQTVRMTDAEREQVAQALRDACADGRLERDELEERVDRAYRAKCWADVKPLLEDLGLSL